MEGGGGRPELAAALHADGGQRDGQSRLATEDERMKRQKNQHVR